MAEQPGRDRSDATSGVSSMLAWLGFFLLVFVVAGLGFYLAGEPGTAPGADRPALATHSGS